jgi:hypothetical protein
VIPAHANGDGPHPRYQASPVRLVVGATYRFKGHADAKGRWLYRPGGLPPGRLGRAGPHLAGGRRLRGA